MAIYKKQRLLVSTSFNNGFHLQERSREQKKTVSTGCKSLSTRQRNLSPPYGVKNLFTNTFLLDKNTFYSQEYLENEKKNDFRQPKIQFPQVEIRFLLKGVLRPNFKFFNEALLNKTLLFLLDRKFVLTSQNEEFVKKTFLFEGKLFSLTGVYDKWEKRFFTCQKNSFFQEQCSFSVKIDFRIISIMAFISKKNIINTEEHYFTQTEKDFRPFLLLAKIILEVRKNPIF